MLKKKKRDEKLPTPEWSVGRPAGELQPTTLQYKSSGCGWSSVRPAQTIVLLENVEWRVQDAIQPNCYVVETFLSSKNSNSTGHSFQPHNELRSPACGTVSLPKVVVSMGLKPDPCVAVLSI